MPHDTIRNDPPNMFLPPFQAWLASVAQKSIKETALSIHQKWKEKGSRYCEPLNNEEATALSTPLPLTQPKLAPQILIRKELRKLSQTKGHQWRFSQPPHDFQGKFTLPMPQRSS